MNYGRIENLPKEIREKVPFFYQEIRKIFLEPEVTDEYSIKYEPLMEDKLYDFLCVKKGFSKTRVEKAVRRLKLAQKKMQQPGLETWM